MYNCGLILEGGGMRGVYTAGVLDFFMDKGLEFKNNYGVSAGICLGCSYLSKQRGRGYTCFVDPIGDKNYASLYSWLKTGDYFNVYTTYDYIPNIFYPFDYEEYSKRKGHLIAVVTNVETGKAEYVELTDMEKEIIYVRASSSLPLMSKIVEIDGKLYLDGGVADSIPIRKSREDGNERNVVVLTRPEGYRKKKNALMPLMSLKYRKYPNFIQTMATRHVDYNESLDIVAQGELDNNTFVIKPSVDMEIGRLEKDKEKLKELYELGYNDAKNQYEDLMHFLRV